MPCQPEPIAESKRGLANSQTPRKRDLFAPAPVKLSLLAASHPHLSRFRYLELLIIMGALQAIAPLSIDMYLPAMPQLERVFHATTASVQVTMVTFFIGYSLGQTLYGPLTDRFGRKPPLYFSLLIYMATCAACALAPGVQILSAMRLLQALGACGGAVISRAMVRDQFPPEDLRRVFSMLILVLGVSPLIAPLLGSYLLIWFGWHAIFWMQGALGAACLLGVHFRMTESLAPQHRRSLEMTHIVSGYRELLRDRTFVGASLVCGFSSAGMFAYISGSPFVLIDFYKIPTQMFGWLFACIAAGVIVSSQINGRMPHRIALWKVLRTANVVQLVAGVLMVAAAFTGFGGAWGVFIPVFAYMCGAGFVFPNGSAIAMMRHGNMAGMASALLGTIQFLVAAVGTILMGTIESSTAIPMTVIICACGVAATVFNFTMLGSRLESGPAPAPATAVDASH